MRDYFSDRANQNHQLTIAVSKHWYITRDGRMQRQEKPFDVNLGTCHESPKTHVMNYLIRDHYSGLFYGDIARSDAPRAAEDFLNEAWASKPNYPFMGPPENLSVAKTLLAVLPNVAGFLGGKDVRMVEPTSGFHAGVRDIRTWEDGLRFLVALIESRGEVATFDAMQAERMTLCQLVCCGEQGGPSKADRYQESLGDTELCIRP